MKTKTKNKQKMKVQGKKTKVQLKKDEGVARCTFSVRTKHSSLEEPTEELRIHHQNCIVFAGVVLYKNSAPGATTSPRRKEVNTGVREQPGTTQKRSARPSSQVVLEVPPWQLVGQSTSLLVVVAGRILLLVRTRQDYLQLQGYDDEKNYIYKKQH